MGYTKIDRQNYNFVCEKLENSEYPSDFWKKTLLSHVKACLAIVERDFNTFVSCLNDSDYLLTSSPEFLGFDKENDDHFYDLEKIPVSGTVYVNAKDDVLDNNHQYDTSLMFLIYETSRNVKPGHEDWEFFKKVTNYLKDRYFPVFLKLLDSEYIDNSDKKFNCDEGYGRDYWKLKLASEFRSVWQNYIHFLHGSSELIEFEEYRAKFEHGFFSLICSIKSNGYRILNEAVQVEDLLFIKDHETFKMLANDIFQNSLEKVLDRTFYVLPPECYLKNLDYLLSHVPERVYKYLEMGSFSHIYHKIMINFINLEEDYKNYSSWLKFINREKSLDENLLGSVVDKINELFKKKYETIYGKSLKDEMLFSLSWAKIVNLSLQRRRRENEKMLEKLGKKVYSTRLDDCKQDFIALKENLNNSEYDVFIELLKNMDVPESFYKNSVKI